MLIEQMIILGLLTCLASAKVALDVDEMTFLPSKDRDWGDFVSDVFVHYAGGGEERLKVLSFGEKLRIESNRDVYQYA